MLLTPSLRLQGMQTLQAVDKQLRETISCRAKIGSVAPRAALRRDQPATNPDRPLVAGSMQPLQPRRRDSAAAPLVAKAATTSIDNLGFPEQAVSLEPVLLAAAVAALGAFCFGFHLGVLNGPLAAIAGELGFAGQPALAGAVVSSCLAGAALGSLGGAGLAQRFGRKGTLLLDVIPLFLGAFLCATANSFAWIVTGRVIVGIGIGLASGLVPLYISEIAPPEVRGAIGSLNQLTICLGILAALVVNVVFPPTAWRVMFWLATIPAGLLAFGLLFVPESPRWLFANDKLYEAQMAAARLWGPSGPALLSEGRPSAPGGQGAPQKPGLFKLLTTKSVVISMLIFVFQQFAGINAIIYFSSSVFAQAGVQSGALASAGVGATNVFGTLIAGSLVDRAGRKQLLLVSFLGMAASMLCMSAGLALPQLAAISGNIALFGTLAYVLSFAVGVGPVPGILVSEINSNAIRGSAVAMAMVTHWVCNYAIGQLFLPVVAKFGVSTVYLGFAGICVLAAVFVMVAVLETKGRSLDEIARLMGN